MILNLQHIALTQQCSTLVRLDPTNTNYMATLVIWVTAFLNNTLAPRDGYGYSSWVIYEAATY